MKFVSVDIETTGLNPVEDAILEIAAIYYDTAQPKDFQGCPKFHGLVYPETGKWNVDFYILRLHQELFKEMEHIQMFGFENPIPNSRQVFDSPKIVGTYFQDFLEQVSGGDKLTLAGKNIAGFDLPFIKEQFKINPKIRHRVLDPGCMFLKKWDVVVPDLQECKERANLQYPVKHRAMDDAWDVCKLIQYHFDSLE